MMKIILSYLKIYISKIKLLFGIKLNSEYIPEGMYCYTPTGEKGFTKEGLPYFGIKLCKHFVYLEKAKTGCTYIGFSGYDVCHNYQCKICGVNQKD